VFQGSKASDNVQSKSNKSSQMPLNLTITHLVARQLSSKIGIVLENKLKMTNSSTVSSTFSSRHEESPRDGL
jgi:hypothetical protein